MIGGVHDPEDLWPPEWVGEIGLGEQMRVLMYRALAAERSYDSRELNAVRHELETHPLGPEQALWGLVVELLEEIHRPLHGGIRRSNEEWAALYREMVFEIRSQLETEGTREPDDE